VTARLGIALALALSAACGGGGSIVRSDGGADSSRDDLPGNADAGSGEDSPTDAALGGYNLPSFPGGYDFFYLLPPSFAQFLPLGGQGATREPDSASFYDTTSAYYFSYAFVWWLDGAPDLSTAALTSDLGIYYTGLCPSQTVKVTLADPGPAAADGSVTVLRRAGTLDAGTCFGNPVPVATLEVSSYDCPGHQAVLVLVSPQAMTSQVWTDLTTIRDGFACW
jgi:hypothetical protein